MAASISPGHGIEQFFKERSTKPISNWPARPKAFMVDIKTRQATGFIEIDKGFDWALTPTVMAASTGSRCRQSVGGGLRWAWRWPRAGEPAWVWAPGRNRHTRRRHPSGQATKTSVPGWQCGV